MKNKIFTASLILAAFIIPPIVSAAPPVSGKSDPKIIKKFNSSNTRPALPPGYIEGILIKPKTYIADGKSSIYIYATGIGVCDDLQLVYDGVPQNKTKKNYDLNAHTGYWQGMLSRFTPGKTFTVKIKVQPGPKAKRCKGSAEGTLVVRTPKSLKKIPRNLFR